MTLNFQQDNGKRCSKIFTNLDYAADFLQKHICFSKFSVKEIRQFLKFCENFPSVKIRDAFSEFDISNVDFAQYSHEIEVEIRND